MAKTFKVNGTNYPIRELDFNFMCELEDRGVSIENIADKPLKILREYLAVTAGKSSEWAGKEIEQHIIGGGNMTEVYDALNEAMESSGFFQAMSGQSQESEEEVGETSKAKKPAK